MRRFAFPSAARIPDINGALLLHFACRGSCPFETIKYLGDAGGVETIQQKDANGCLPLHLLFLGESDEEILTEVESGEGKSDEEESNEVEIGDEEAGDEGSSDEVSDKKTLETVKYLVEAHPDSLRQQTMSGDVPLTLAAKKAKLDVIYFLLRKYPAIVKPGNQQTAEVGSAASHLPSSQELHSALDIIRRQVDVFNFSADVELAVQLLQRAVPKMQKKLPKFKTTTTT